MKKAFAFAAALLLLLLNGCTRQHYAALEEAVRAGASIPSGVTIDGLDISGMDIVQARRLINANNEERLAAMNFEITLMGRSVNVSAQKLNVRFNADEALLAAANLGTPSLFDDGSRALYTAADASLNDIERGIREAAAELRQEAKPAAVKLAPDGEFAISADEVGYEVDRAALAKLLKEKINEGKSASVQAPAVAVYAEYTVAQAKNDTQLIAEFSTDFKGSTYGKANRVKNIIKAAELLNKSVVEQGGIFSINRALGDRNEENGWYIAAGIRDGAYVQEYGGGVCQVSTTLYNALLMADIHIVERHHHSWPLGYVDIGRDATISTGGPDLRFENTTGAALFILCNVNEKQKRITVSLYGRPLADGVSIKLSSQKIETLKDPGTEMEEDASLAPGEQIIVRKARQGSVAVTYKTFYSKDGEKLYSEEVTRDTYHSIKGLIKVAPAASAAAADNSE